MTVLISEHNGLYQHDEPENESKTSQQQQQQQQSSTPQRCMVEWVSQEHSKPSSLETSSKTPKEESRPSTPSTDCNARALTPTAAPETSDVGQTEDRGSTADKGDEGKGGGDAAFSPSKQVKAQPSWKKSFKGGATSAGARGKIGGSTGDVSTGGGGKWRMNGLSLRAHRRTTSSGEKLKDSTASLKDSTLSLKETALRDLQRDSDEDSPQMSHRAVHQSHRLSAYDNVAPSILSLPADTSSIWTSFEISLAEPKGSDKSAKSGQAQEMPAEARDNANTMDQSASGTDTDNAEASEGLANMLTELKQELKKQRTSYEACIRKYEPSLVLFSVKYSL